MSIQIDVSFRKKLVVDVLFNGMQNNCFEIPLVDSDTCPTLEFHCTDSNGNLLDLTGATVKFFFKKYCESSHRNVGHEICTITNVTGGIAEYEWVSGDISGAGTYYGDIQVTYDDGCVETAAEACRFKVRENNQ